MISTLDLCLDSWSIAEAKLKLKEFSEKVVKPKISISCFPFFKTDFHKQYVNLRKAEKDVEKPFSANTFNGQHLVSNTLANAARIKKQNML